MYTFKAKVGDMVIVHPINEVGEVVHRRFSTMTGADIYTIKFTDPTGESMDTFLSFLGDEIDKQIPDPPAKVDSYILAVNYKRPVPNFSQDKYQSRNVDKMMAKVSALVSDIANGRVKDILDIRILPVTK